MFFMGVSNAFFVALSVPLSVFIAFMFLPFADMIVGTNVTLNFIVLFALLFGLGIIVDDAIVVIENTHRIFNNGKVPIVKSRQRWPQAKYLCRCFPVLLQHWLHSFHYYSGRGSSGNL